MKNLEKNIGVDFEYGTLKEVIVGPPNMYMPKKLPAYLKDFLSEDAYQMYEKLAGSTVEKVYPEIHKKQVEQVDAVVELLRSRGVKVHVCEHLTEAEKKFGVNQVDSYQSNTYMRDAMVVIDNNFIETNMFDPGRRRDRFSIRRTLQERLKGSNAKIVAMPEPIIDWDGDSFADGIFLEGGDTFVLGKNILVGNTGNASNTAGIEWLQNYLGEEYNVQEVRLSNNFVHLDCVLSTLRPGLALIVKEAFLDGIPDLIKDWTFVDVSPEDAEKYLATNALVLDNKTVLMSASLGHISKEIRKHNHEVIEMPFDALEWQGGSFRCWHHPLIREVNNN
ncbi:hypothetical protein EI427_19555 [Flammeovirga pectinis]|uniref:Amidinotransferase n=1 Tax=Flammeovirga pectinis TaxID=2494373 RepID=A0A3Q9FTV5_9BACT|nr:arginine deiminase family protein [Flammeovirga pectinis]AZQ64328.1 hypothetical protein EI427_19555 [Flammeovirga pectinis]